jgi:hypothetical protein
VRSAQPRAPSAVGCSVALAGGRRRCLRRGGGRRRHWRTAPCVPGVGEAVPAGRRGSAGWCARTQPSVAAVPFWKALLKRQWCVLALQVRRAADTESGPDARYASVCVACRRCVRVRMHAPRCWPWAVPVCRARVWWASTVSSCIVGSERAEQGKVLQACCVAMRSTSESSPDESLADEGAPHEVFIRQARAALAEGDTDEEAMVRTPSHQIAAHVQALYLGHPRAATAGCTCRHSLTAHAPCPSLVVWASRCAFAADAGGGEARVIPLVPHKSAPHAVLLAAQTKLVDDAEAECAALVKERAAVAAQLAAAEENLEVSRAQFLRLNADFDNFRKRTARPPSPEHAAGAGRSTPPRAAPRALPLRAPGRCAAAPAPRRTRTDRS